MIDDLVVRLVPVAQPLEDLHALLERRLVDRDLLEAPLQRRVPLQVLAVLVERRGAHRLQLAARQRRLEDRRSVDRALRGARADEVVQLVDEQDDVAALGDLLHHLLQALLELAAVLRARDQRGQVERVDLLVLEQLRHVAVGDALGQALDHRGLAHAGLADEHGVVLRAAREDLHDPLDLGLAADDGVQLALGGELGQVAPELVEQLRGLLALALGGTRAGAGALALAGAGAAPARTGQHADDLVADLLGVRVEVEQDARGHALVLAHQAEQDVLGADVVVTQRQGLAQRELEHLLGARGERDLAGGDLLAGADDAHHLGAYALHGDVEALEHASRQALLLAEQAEQDVLGADVVVLEGPRLLLGEDDHLSSSLCESLEHGGGSFLPAKCCPSGGSFWWSVGRLGGLSGERKIPRPSPSYSAPEPVRMSVHGVRLRPWGSLPTPRTPSGPFGEGLPTPSGRVLRRGYRRRPSSRIVHGSTTST